VAAATTTGVRPMSGQGSSDWAPLAILSPVRLRKRRQ
jgi:hypothetical protein